SIFNFFYGLLNTVIFIVDLHRLSNGESLQDAFLFSPLAFLINRPSKSDNNYWHFSGLQFFDQMCRAYPYRLKGLSSTLRKSNNPTIVERSLNIFGVLGIYCFFICYILSYFTPSTLYSYSSGVAHNSR